MIDLTLAENIPNIAKTGDHVILKDDGTFEIKKAESDWNLEAAESKVMMEEDKKKKEKEKKDIEKEFAGYTDFADCVSKNKDKGDPDAYCGSIKHKVEDTKKSDIDPRIEKYLSIDDKTAWQLLTKFYENGHLPAYKVLKSFINKTAQCPDISEKFDDVMVKWMTEGDANISSIEKIINSCKKEGGNIDKSSKIINEVVDKSSKIINEVVDKGVYSHSSFSSDSSSDTQDEKEKKRREDRKRNSEERSHNVDPGKARSLLR